MKVIAESGSTTTEWVLVDGKNVLERSFTEGINPFFQTRREISHSIRLNLPETFFKKRWERVYFYGAGCANLDKKNILEASLVAQFKTPISAESDLLAAARGLLIDKPGIACILGTGSNSCLYDGERIIKNVRSAGYILGDEGSGTALGKRLIGDWLKGLLDEELNRKLAESYRWDEADIIRKVYREPEANRFLASFTPFLKAHRTHPAVHRILTDCFKAFFERNIMAYRPGPLAVHFVGSIAAIFREELEETAGIYGIRIGNILREPIGRMVAYHQQKLKNETD